MIRFQLGPLADDVSSRLVRARDERVVQRILDRDPTVWSSDPNTAEIRDRLGWLDLPRSMRSEIGELERFAEEVRGDVDRVVLCGMGGSSLAPEVLWRVFGQCQGFPRFTLLDSTHPSAVVEAGTALDRSLFVIASKSGSTIETASFERYFWERTGRDGTRFVAITDPDTELAHRAREHKYRRVFANPADIGGRYSALSLFGLVPATLLGIDAGRLLASAADVDLDDFVALGVAMGVAARSGRDKLTVRASPTLAPMGLWLEQLIAESTGKDGAGILPVLEADDVEIAPNATDRLVVRLALAGETDETEDGGGGNIGSPAVEITLSDHAQLGAQFIGWEMATAVAAHVLGVHPFNQPNVTESKLNTARALERAAQPGGTDSAEVLRVWRQGIRPGDYVAVVVFSPPCEETDRRLRAVQRALQRSCGVAVTTAYGPRYLHSTGQLHKGGPPTGHYLQVVEHAAEDVAIPGVAYGFARLIGAQAAGDREALRARGRPVVRVGWDLLEQEFGA